MTYGVSLDKETIDRLATESETVSKFMLALYRWVFGDAWDEIVEIDTDSYPQCGEETWQYICQICIDKSRSEDLPPMGGLNWMNKGFSVDANLVEWYVWIQPVPLQDGTMYPSEEMVKDDADPRASMMFPGGEA